MRIFTFLSILFVLFASSSLQAQQELRGVVKEAQSGETMAFVAIYVEGTQNGCYSDIDGKFLLRDVQVGSKLVFRYLGFSEKKLVWDGSLPLEVSLVGATKDLAEVVIRPGVNPAERIINLAIENKAFNNPEKAHSFTYDSYNKLFFDVVADTNHLAVKEMMADTAEGPGIEELKTFHLFLVETVSQRKFLPPANSEETIIANRVSGFKNPEFALLGTQLQSFSFYGDYVELMSTKYLSPLTKGSPKKYLFIIEDTTYIDKDTVFTISFRPRKGKNFTGMKGQLFINSDGYALQNVFAEPAEPDASLSIKIQQRYEKVKAKAWFPVQLNSFISMNMLQVDGMEVIGEGRSYIQNIELDPPLRSKEFTPVTLLMKKGAQDQPDSLWNSYRITPLDTVDLKTYHVIDSVSQAENIEQKMAVFQALMSGKIPVGKFDVDIDRLFRFNSYEGLRLGVGVHTSDRLSPYFSIGGYGGYGFKDKAWKYGGDAKVNLYRKRAMWIKFSGEHDVRETAGNQFMPGQGAGLVMSDYYPLFVNRMDTYEKFEVRLNGRVYRNFTLSPFINQQTISPYQGIEYFTTSSSEDLQVQVATKDFKVAEVGAQLRWAPGEKLVRMGEREIRLGGRFPILHLKYTQGIEGMLDGQFSYTRYDAVLEKKFLIKNIGELSVKAVGGMIGGEVPYSLLYNNRGTRQNWSVASPETFETMALNGFQYTSFAAMHIRHSFKELLFKRPKFRPQLVVVHNMIISDDKKPNGYSVDMKTLEKGYFESGLQIDGLIKSGISGIGIGGFYRYGNYARNDFKKDVILKITIAILV